MSFEPIDGLTWKQHAARGIYLAQYSDDNRFPDGESIEDVAVRARAALEKLVLPVSYLQLYWQMLVFGSAVRNFTCPSANLMGFVLQPQMSFASHPF